MPINIDGYTTANGKGTLSKTFESEYTLTEIAERNDLKRNVEGAVYQILKHKKNGYTQDELYAYTYDRFTVDIEDTIFNDALSSLIQKEHIKLVGDTYVHVP